MESMHLERALRERARWPAPRTAAIEDVEPLVWLDVWPHEWDKGLPDGLQALENEHRRVLLQEEQHVPVHRWVERLFRGSWKAAA